MFEVNDQGSGQLELDMMGKIESMLEVRMSKMGNQLVWRQCKLGDIVSFQRGFDITQKDQQKGHYPVVSSSGIKSYHSEGKVKSPGVVIGRKGTLGTVFYLDIDFWPHDTTLWVKDFHDNYPLFISYFLKEFNFEFYDVGSSNPTLNRNHIHLLPAVIPPLPEQKAIAAVLSSLDDKIDLLHRQNATLEAMAETLFRQWFVEEAQADWEEKPLCEVAIVQNGYAFSSKNYVDYEERHLEVFKMGHIKPGGGLRFSPKSDYVPRERKLEKWILNKNDIVMAMTDMKDNMGILAHPALIDESDKYVLNQRVARIYVEKDSELISNYLLYLFLKNEDSINFLQSQSNSGVQVNLSTESIKSFPLLIPPRELQQKVLNIVGPVMTKINQNSSQIQTLTKLRDNLLPKLMSGEVRVKLNEAGQ